MGTQQHLAAVLLVGLGLLSASQEMPDNLPECTEAQLAAALPSYACVVDTFGVPFSGDGEGSGNCPSECCCDIEPTDSGTVRRYIQAGACAIEGELGPSNAILSSYVMPYTVDPEVDLSVSGLCQKRVPGTCEELIGDGCWFDFAALLPPDAAAENDRRKDGAANEDDDEPVDEDESSSGQADEANAESSNSLSRSSIIALSACIAVVGILLMVAVGVFIVRPFLAARREEQSDASALSDEEQEHTNGKHSARGEIDVELMKLDEMSENRDPFESTGDYDAQLADRNQERRNGSIP